MFEDSTTTFRRDSVDFSLPPDLPTPAETPGKVPEPLYFVPLAYFPKHTLVRFSIEDASKRALPLLGRRANGLLAAATLVALAKKNHRDNPGPFPEEIESELFDLATTPQRRAEQIWRTLYRRKVGETGHVERWRADLTDDEEFMGLALDLSRNFLAVTEYAGPPGRRTIVKLSYNFTSDPVGVRPPKGLGFLGGLWARSSVGYSPRYLTMRAWFERFLGLRAHSVLIPANRVGQTASYHIEIQAPDGMLVTTARLAAHEPIRGTLFRRSDTVRHSVERAHLCLDGVPQGYAAEVKARLRPRDSTIVRPALLTAVLTFLLLLAVTVWWRTFTDNLGQTTSLLLFIPAGLAAWVARARENPATTAAIFGLRVLALGSAFWPVLAAVFLVASRTCSTDAGTTTCESPAVTWLPLSVLSALSFLNAVGIWRTLRRVLHPPEQKL